LLIDALEFMNSIYEDMSGLNELFGFKSQNCLTPDGVAMFVNGFQIVSTLEPRLVSPTIQAAKMHGLLSGGTL
jgi:hypothetical protein